MHLCDVSPMAHPEVLNDFASSNRFLEHWQLADLSGSWIRDAHIQKLQ